MQLESTTYHYAVRRPDDITAADWPDSLLRANTRSRLYRPDYLSFDIHVTHDKHTVRAVNILLGGPRVLKHGLSDDRESDRFFGVTSVPDFAAKYIERALAHHGG